MSAIFKFFKRPFFKATHTIPIIYHPNYNISFLGLEKLHSFDSKKYGHIADSLTKFFDHNSSSSIGYNFSQPKVATEKDLLLIHTPEYLNSLKRSSVVAQAVEVHPLKYIPNFLLQRYLLNAMKLATGGTILGAELALRHGWAINLSGGYHHAKADHGEGFCLYADIPIAIHKLWQTNPNLKVMIIDLDAHQGNGVSSILKNDKRTFIFDMYNADVYPQDVEAQQYTNKKIKLKIGTDTQTYLDLLHNELPNAIETFKPDLIIYNAGTDIFQKDHLGKLNISKDGIIKRDEFVFQSSFQNNIPILMVLSGGYTKESANIIGKSIENVWDKFLRDKVI